MEATVREADGIAVIAFEGAMDTNTSVEANDLFTKLLDEGKTQIVVNFDKLNYITSAGIRVFMKAEKRLKKLNGGLSFCCLNHSVQDVFHIAGLTYRWAIFVQEAEAIESSKISS